MREFIDSIRGIPYNVFDRKWIFILSAACTFLGIAAILAGYLLGH